MGVIARAECPVCGFWKNSAADVGGPCRRIGCDGTVERVEYVRASQLAGAVEALRRIVLIHEDTGAHPDNDAALDAVADIARTALTALGGQS
jgi:hypothetical protein